MNKKTENQIKNKKTAKTMVLKNELNNAREIIGSSLELEKEEECEIERNSNNILLDSLKNKIESMNKMHHIEILKILKKYSAIKLNENKSGVYINLSFLQKEAVDDLQQYIHYIEEQESTLMTMEYQKEEFKNTFFKESSDNSEEYSAHAISG